MRKETWKLLVVSVATLLVAAGFAKVSLDLLRKAPPESPTGPVAAPTTPSPSSERHGCPARRLKGVGRLGTVAWAEAGALRTVELATCRERTLLGTGVKAPIRYSPDGDWIAFGLGEVVASAGGPVSHPFGAPVRAWQWSPVSDVLAGVTNAGALIVAGPDRAATTVTGAGSAVGSPVFSPDGRRLAFGDAGVGIRVIDLATERAHTIFFESDPALAPLVAGWTRDGRWVLYWRGPVSRARASLDAAPAGGGSWVNAYEPTLPYPDFVSGCGARIAVVAGDGLTLSEGKQVIVTGPPTWSFHNLTDDFSRSWYWPACSPNGRWLAVSDTFNRASYAGAAQPGALWVIATDGSVRRRLVAGTHRTIEYPRWSADGATILAIERTGDTWSSPGRLVLVRIDPRSGRLVRRTGPIANLGSAPGPGGHQRWSEVSDWYQP